MAADGIRRVARAYYERASDEEKKEAKKFYRKLDPYGDGEIRFAEFQKGIASWLAEEEVFRKLDSNGDGALDFFDVLVLFYISKGRIVIHRCNGCNEKLFGPYFSCIICLSKYPDTYDLCCDCYRGGELEHRHPLSNFLHDHGLLSNFMRQTNTQAKGEMEELRNTAMLQYQATPVNVKARAKEFFVSMDRDGDGRVNVRDFFLFMWEQGLDHLSNHGLFEELDMNGDGVLDFEEVMTLLYIIKSGRPHCNWCKKFIPGVFFSCVHCFSSQRSFNLCRTCYQSNDCNHAHSDATHFLDNYTLLQTMKESSLVDHHHQQSAEPSSSRAIVPASGKTKSDVAYKALDLAISISEMIGKIADAAASRCAIM